MTTEQVLAVLLADLHADVAGLQVTIQDAQSRLAQLTPKGKTGPLPPVSDTPLLQWDVTAQDGCQEQRRAIDYWQKETLPPLITTVAASIYATGSCDITRSRLQQRLTDASLTVDTFWRMRGIQAEGSIHQFNAVLVLALGPYAPQFVLDGDGWALVDNS